MKKLVLFLILVCVVVAVGVSCQLKKSDVFKINQQQVEQCKIDMQANPNLVCE